MVARLTATKSGRARAIDAWRAPEVREFVERCRNHPALLQHANETWAMGARFPVRHA